MAEYPRGDRSSTGQYRLGPSRGETFAPGHDASAGRAKRGCVGLYERRGRPAVCGSRAAGLLAGFRHGGGDYHEGRDGPLLLPSPDTFPSAPKAISRTGAEVSDAGATRSWKSTTRMAAEFGCHASPVSRGTGGDVAERLRRSEQEALDFIGGECAVGTSRAVRVSSRGSMNCRGFLHHPVRV